MSTTISLTMREKAVIRDVLVEAKPADRATAETILAIRVKLSETGHEMVTLQQDLDNFRNTHPHCHCFGRCL